VVSLCLSLWHDVRLDWHCFWPMAYIWQINHAVALSVSSLPLMSMPGATPGNPRSALNRQGQPALGASPEH